MAKVYNKISKALFETDLKNARELSIKYNFIEIKEIDETEKNKLEDEKNKKTSLENKILNGNNSSDDISDNEFENLKKEATELGLSFNYNIGFDTLKERVEAKKEELKNSEDNKQ